MKKYSIGIDIGGMSIKGGLVNEKGEILSTEKVVTCRNADKDLNNIISLVNSLLDKNGLSVSDIAGVGIGCPGATDSESGVVEYLPNLNWEKVRIVDILSERLNTKVKITNDANAAGLAEYTFGAAKGCDLCVMFTIGTGVGGAVIEKGKIFEGSRGKGAELGHVTLVLDGIPCACGRKGCIEKYVSATALIEQTKAAAIKDKNSLIWKLVDNDLINVNGKTVFDAVQMGDSTAKKVFDNYVKYLSESIMSMLNVFRPQVFVIGGGVSAQGDFLILPVIKYCEKYFYGYKGTPTPKIVPAKLGNDAGIIGAAVLVW